jgi:hypothetical protein
MRIATYEGEKSMPELVARLFNITGAKAGLRQQEAEAALREANPHLRDLRSVPVGTPIVVPDLRGVRPSKESRPVRGDVQALVRTLQGSLGEVAEALDDSARLAGEAVNQDLALLRSKEVKDLAAQDRNLARKVKDLTASSQRLRTETKAHRAAQADAVAQLRTDLEEFLGLHGG